MVHKPVSSRADSDIRDRDGSLFSPPSTDGEAKASLLSWDGNGGHLFHCTIIDG